MTFARIRALAVIGVLVVSALVVVTIAVVRDRQGTDLGAGCPDDAVIADIRVREAKDVKVNVYNATATRNGLAAQVAEDFRNRRFLVQEVTNRQDNRVKGVAVLRYGPKSVGGAWLVRAYFLDEAETEFDIKRQDDVIDVILGPQFQELGSTTEVNQSIAALGKPKLPKGTCAATTP